MDINYKKCSICKKVKKLTEFSKDKKYKNGLNAACKECANNYNRSKSGIVLKIYRDQKKSSNRRNMELPNYTKEELKTWVYAQSNFETLYDTWVNSGYKRDLVPSIDRLNDYKPYTLNNISLKTWRENFLKSVIDTVNGKNTKRTLEVSCYSIDGEYITTYYSISQASRETNIDISAIAKCCKNKIKQAGSFQWRLGNSNLNIGLYRKGKKVEQLSLENKILAKFNSIKEAAIATNTNESSIIKVCKKQNRKAGGFKWKYI